MVDRFHLTQFTDHALIKQCPCFFERGRVATGRTVGVLDPRSLNGIQHRARLRCATSEWLLTKNMTAETDRMHDDVSMRTTGSCHHHDVGTQLLNRCPPIQTNVGDVKPPTHRVSRLLRTAAKSDNFHSGAAQRPRVALPRPACTDHDGTVCHRPSPLPVHLTDLTLVQYGRLCTLNMASKGPAEPTRRPRFAYSKSALQAASAGDLSVAAQSWSHEQPGVSSGHTDTREGPVSAPTAAEPNANTAYSSNAAKFAAAYQLGLTLNDGEHDAAGEGRVDSHHYLP
jgi:hypothetical protein